MGHGKQNVRYFISYAHGDKPLKEDCLKRLGPLLHCAKTYEFIPWDDGDIVVGEDWFSSITHAIQQCDFGLLLVSPAFLSSSFISAHELPKFLPSSSSGYAKRAVPVALKPIDFSRDFDLKGLEHMQIFRDADGKAFQQRSTGNTKDEWVRQLFQKIIQVASKCQ